MLGLLLDSCMLCAALSPKQSDVESICKSDNNAGAWSFLLSMMAANPEYLLGYAESAELFPLIESHACEAALSVDFEQEHDEICNPCACFCAQKKSGNLHTIEYMTFSRLAIYSQAFQLFLGAEPMAAYDFLPKLYDYDNFIATHVPLLGTYKTPEGGLEYYFLANKNLNQINAGFGLNLRNTNFKFNSTYISFLVTQDLTVDGEVVFPQISFPVSFHYKPNSSKIIYNVIGLDTPPFVTGVSDVILSDYSRSDLCEFLQSTCTGNYTQFESKQECMVFMKDIPDYSQHKRCSIIGNTRACRNLHSIIARLGEIDIGAAQKLGSLRHCFHSGTGNEDPDGFIKCSEELEIECLKAEGVYKSTPTSYVVKTGLLGIIGIVAAYMLN